MRSSAAFLATCVFFFGCDRVAPIAPVDGGDPIVLSDGGVDPIRPDAEIPVTGCRSNADCEDGDPCTENTCMENRCWNGRVAGCSECATNADCDDGFHCSLDSCFGGLCSYEWNSAECDCAEDAHCDDYDAATTDRCEGYRCVNERRSCSADAECDDGVACTRDSCAGGTCANERTIACDSSCPDYDGDGHGSRWCFGGDDCDDVNAAIHPGAAEACDDDVDNDCDGRIDFIDDACSTGGETCASARTITAGTPVDGAIRWDTASGSTMTPCGESNFFTIALTETSDVDVTVTLREPPPPTPVPGCPECTSDRMWQYWYRLFFERTCGDTATDLGGAGTGCLTWSDGGFFGGSGTYTLRLRRVPAGTYTIEVQASDFHAWMPVAIEYTLEASVTPSAAPMCDGAVALSEGATVRGDTSTGTNAFGTDCSGTIADVAETIHTFTLAERRRVRLEAAGVPDASGVVPGLRVGLYGACDPASARTDCMEQTGRECHPRATMETVLDAGTYWAIVEANYATTASYDLTLTTEPVGAACEGAAVISASGSYSGSTTTAPDVFRDHRVCGDGYGPDVAYRVEVSARSRVVLDLIASYEGEMLTLYRGCGEARVAGGRTSTHIDLELDPGTYTAVVGGQQPTNAGSFVLNATFVPSAP